MARSLPYCAFSKKRATLCLQSSGKPDNKRAFEPETWKNLMKASRGAALSKYGTSNVGSEKSLRPGKSVP